MLADTYEQLGYGSENGTWRTFYLSGATELRNGRFGTPTVTTSPDMIGQLSPEMLFDAIAIRVDGPRDWDEQLTVDIGLSDTDQHYRLSLTNGVLTYSAAKQSEPADVSLTSSRASLPALALGPFDAESLAEAGIDVSGDAGVLTRLAAVLEGGDADFAIVTPE